MKLMKYRNLILFIVISILSIYLGFFRISFIDKSFLYVKGIYYCLCINILLFGLTIFEILKNSKNSYIIFFKKHSLAIIISFILITISIYNCKPEFRIFADEMYLLSTSQNIYETNECLADLSSIKHLDGNKEIFIKIIDKRPALFPVLTCIIHSLIGYNHQNPFILNYLCGILILFLFYLLVSFRYGRFYGILGLICLYIHPLFVWYVNSAGFDILNVLCSLILFLLCWFFFKNPCIIHAEAILLFLPILGQSRYESSLIVFLALPFIFYLLPKTKYSEFTYKLWIFPLLLLPIAWLRTLTNFVDNSEGMDYSNPFSFEYFIENTKQAIVFFFSGIKEYGVVPIISIMALIGFSLYILKIKKEFILDKNTAMASFVAFFYLIHAIVKFSFCLGDITDVLANRHALILLPIIVYLAINFLVFFKIKYRFSQKFYIVGAIFLFLMYSLDFGKSYDINQMPTPRKFRFIKNYLENNHKNKNNYLLIYQYPIFFTPLGYSSISFNILKKYADNFTNYYKGKNNQYFLSIQTMDAKTEKPIIGEELPTSFTTEKIFEQKLEEGRYLRVSKCYPN